MTAFTKLIEFVGKLPQALQPEYRKLIDNYISERDRMQNERIGQNMATTGNFEVIAIAGTVETLLNDEIKANDIIYFVDNGVYDEGDLRRLKADKIKENEPYKVDRIEYYYNVPQVCIGKKYIHPAKYFRKVQTPLSNPHQTVEGC